MPSTTEGIDYRRSSSNNTTYIPFHKALSIGARGKWLYKLKDMNVFNNIEEVFDRKGGVDMDIA